MGRNQQYKNRYRPLQRCEILVKINNVSFDQEMIKLSDFKDPS